MHRFALLSVDVALIAISTLMAIALCSPQASSDLVGTYLLFTMAVAVPALLIFGLNRTVWRFTSLNDCLPILAVAIWIVALATAAVFSFDDVQAIPLSLPVMHGLLILCLLVGVRAAMRLRHSLRRRARLARELLARDGRQSVLLVGLSPVADLFLRCAAENAHERIHVAGILSDAERHHGRLLHSCRILGRPEAVEDVFHDLSVHGVRIDCIVLATPLDQLSAASQRSLAHLEKSHGIRVDHLSAQYGLGDLTSTVPATVDDVSSAQINTPPVPVSGGGNLAPSSYLRWKRLIDASVALIGIICLAPAMVVIGIIVMLDVGYPLIFWQQRPGALGKPIRILKFRTMGRARDQNGRALTDAERVSKIGTLLRRLRLDELPQVYNVLLGHMSLVGPRPLLPVDQPSSSAARLQLRPGLTGWAQIKGGRHLSIEDKTALDLWYIRNASFALDMLILLNTARTILFGERVDHRAIAQAWRDLRP
ncbi:sugar transferase [Hyphomicrobium facile]|uniref:Sugar transferase involved in LPS biosynthesis (Colanic, teichoic acid) n=1 Tax=Hyphomicrobium facile TaxID=51670 RepID=A0A1I7NIV2_9HYPH|nr:sugar transferase [Hyphomicrobium facile]SFV34569.1 Sugar transferase involved in LPS biosynthesis (colanic, teichoic acid) [Hyphomicrobium facile]